MRLVDPDGRGVENIIIDVKKNTREEQKKILANLQVLTNDRLDMNPETGEVFVIKRNGANYTKSLPVGTKLVSELIEDNNTVTMVAGRSNGTNPVDEKGRYTSEAEEKVETGVEVDAVVRHNPKGLGENILNADGSSGRPAFIGLAHELIHALDLVKGARPSGETDYPDPEGHRPFLSQAEYKARMKENEIRAEHGVVLRAMPNK